MMKNLLFSISLVLFITCSYAQGINFQGVARSANGTIIASSNVSLRLSIIAKNADALPEYVETKTVLTNAQGIFSIVVGDASNTAVIGNFKNIVWSEGPKFLKVEMDPAGGTNYLNMGSTQLQNVPFSYFSYGVNAANVSGILPITSGGTGASSISALKSNLGIDLVNNVPDIDKPINKATQTAIDAKAPIASPTFTGTVGGITKSMVGLSAVDNTSDLEKPISILTQAALDSKVSSSTFSNTLNTKVSNETFSATIAVKENAANKSAATDLGAGATSDILFPTQKAVKTYVDAQINSGGVADGGIITAKLADAAVTNAKVASGIDKSKVGLGNVENIALSSWQGSNSLNTVGEITSGTWSGSIIDFSKLSIQKTDLTNLGLVGDEDLIFYQAGPGLIGTTRIINQGRRSGSNLVFQDFSVLGVDSTMIGERSIASSNLASNAIINSKIADGSIENSKIADGAVTDIKLASGINKSKVGLGNVENTSLSSWTGSQYLTTVGTISSGTWSASVIPIIKGGTGANNVDDARANLGLVIGTNVQAPLTAGIDYLAPNGSAANLTSFPTLNQNTTGNAATSTIAGNITATSNITLTNLQNLNSVGTITTGIWSATTISVANGGTGSTSLTSNSVLLGNGINSIQTVSPGNSGNVLISNGNTWSSGPISSLAASTLTGTTLPSNIVNSSLTSVGVLSNTIINGKLIVGASSFSSSSAVLEATSTSQGFLPPRLNYYERTQISNPVAGLTIWCSNCGNSGEMQVFNGAEWTNMIGGTATGTINLTIGQSYQGGKVAYILVNGDPGYDPNTQHGFIVATIDQVTTTKWNGSTPPWPLIGTTSSAIGTGFSNTNSIIAIQGGNLSNYAAGIARSYRGGGYNDWYLPSKDELNKIYLNRSIIGGTWRSKYWTSTESSDILFAWFQDFSEFVGYTGVQTEWLKDTNSSVRAIRSF